MRFATKNSQHEIHYPTAFESDTPIFPSTGPWFQWKQRYIYEVLPSKKISYMNGYGDFYPDQAMGEGQPPAKLNVWMNSFQPEQIETAYLMNVQTYTTDFSADPQGFSWLLKGFANLLFQGDLIVFDYPLVLGKTWQSRTRLKGLIPLSVQACVVAFIPPDPLSDKDIKIAPGRNYQLPIALTEIPPPLTELAQVHPKGEWSELLRALGQGPTRLAWNELLVPGGPRKGEKVPGYYVVEISLRLAGRVIMKQEIWKDVRGFVPLYLVKKYFPLSPRAQTLIKLARVWTGTIKTL